MKTTLVTDHELGREPEVLHASTAEGVLPFKHQLAHLMALISAHYGGGAMREEVAHYFAVTSTYEGAKRMADIMTEVVAERQHFGHHEPHP